MGRRWWYGKGRRRCYGEEVVVWGGDGMGRGGGDDMGRRWWYGKGRRR